MSPARLPLHSDDVIVELLAGLHPLDRRWLLAKLDAQDLQKVRLLLQEDGGAIDVASSIPAPKGDAVLATPEPALPEDVPALIHTTWAARDVAKSPVKPALRRAIIDSVGHYLVKPDLESEPLVAPAQQSRPNPRCERMRRWLKSLKQHF